MSEFEIIDLLRNLATVVESMRRRISAVQLESSVTRIALLTTITASEDRVKIAQELRRKAAFYEDLAISTPLSDEEISEYRQAMLSLADQLD